MIKVQLFITGPTGEVHQRRRRREAANSIEEFVERWPARKGYGIRLRARIAKGQEVTLTPINHDEPHHFLMAARGPRRTPGVIISSRSKNLSTVRATAQKGKNHGHH